MNREPDKSELVDEELEQAAGGADVSKDAAASHSGTPPIQISSQQVSGRVSKGPTDPDQVKP